MREPAKRVPNSNRTKLPRWNIGFCPHLGAGACPSVSLLLILATPVCAAERAR